MYLNGKPGVVDITGQEYDTLSAFQGNRALVSIGGKWGYIDKSRQIVIPLKYDNATKFTDGFAYVALGGLWGIINEDGVAIVPFKYDSIKDYDGDVIKVCIADKFGLINKVGQEITPIKYDNIEDFKGNVAKVCIANKFGLINKTGQEIAPIKYENVDIRCDGSTVLSLNGTQSLIDKSGYEIIPIKRDYSSIRSFKEGLAPVMRSGKFGFIDITGQEICPLKYDSVERFENGIAAVCVNDKWGFINRSGEEITPLKYDKTRNRNGHIAVCLNDKWGFINKETGREEIPPILLSCEDGLIAIKKNGVFGLINQYGEEIVPPKYDKVCCFSEGLAAVLLNSTWRFINEFGQEVFALPRGHHLLGRGRFREGLCCVYDDYGHGHIAFIDKAGQICIGFDWEYEYNIDSFGVANFFNGVAKVCKRGCFGLIDRTGNNITQFIYSRIDVPFHCGVTKALRSRYSRSSDLKWGLINTEGKEITDFEYDKIHSWNEDFAEVILEGKPGLIDIKGRHFFPTQNLGAVVNTFWDNRFVVNKNGCWYIVSRP